MAVIWLVAVIMFGCGRVRNSRIEQQLAEEREAAEMEANKNVSVVRNSVQQQLPSHELTVGDVFALNQGDRVPCDCVVYKIESREALMVSETAVNGTRDPVQKQILQHNLYFDKTTVCFANSEVKQGQAFMVALAVGDFSSALAKV